jgi:hypothetical protein
MCMPASASASLGRTYRNDHYMDAELDFGARLATATSGL